MLNVLSKDETIRQSQDAYQQWKETWHSNAKRNGEICKKQDTDIRDIMGVGVNRLGVLCGLGQSLEKHIDLLKEAQNKPGVDILCIDKAFGVLLQRGIKAKYVAVSDAQVSWGTWSKEYIEQTKYATLICTATANPEWAENWLGPVYMVVCKDAINTEKIIGEIAGCDTYVPASANVGNNLLVLCCDILKYNEVLLTGYDYSWKLNKNYYAFSGDADGIMSDKRQWQKNGYTIANDDEFAFQSSNLTFAARWLKNYYVGIAQGKPIKIYNCSDQGILDGIPKAMLDRRLELFEYIEPSEKVLEEIIASRSRVTRVSSKEEIEKLSANSKIYFLDIAHVPKKCFA